MIGFIVGFLAGYVALHAIDFWWVYRQLRQMTFTEKRRVIQEFGARIPKPTARTFIRSLLERQTP